MATLTLKKKPVVLSKSMKKRLAKKWLKENFVFFRDKLHPWKTGIANDVKDKYREGKHVFPIHSIGYCLYIRRTFAEYDLTKPRVDIDGNAVDELNVED